MQVLDSGSPPRTTISSCDRRAMMPHDWIAALGVVVVLARVWPEAAVVSVVADPPARETKAEAETEPDLNAKVVAFCKEALGTPVGDGECYALADRALRAAGAKRAIHYSQEPNRGDYVWGERMVTWSIAPTGKRVRQGHPRDVKPGDIVQFRDAYFERRSPRSISFHSADHHTAVVERITGETLTVLHQNSNGRRDVTRETYRLSDLKRGWVRVDRPQPDDGGDPFGPRRRPPAAPPGRSDPSSPTPSSRPDPSGPFPL